MKHLIYAVIAATSAMLVTSGIVALATAAPERPHQVSHVDPELTAHLDTLIAQQLTLVKERLQR